MLDKSHYLRMFGSNRDCVSFCRLIPGTIILTGTPEGIGAAMDPPRFMIPGDVIECEIENLGTLCNKIVQAPLDGTCPPPQ